VRWISWKERVAYISLVLTVLLWLQWTFFTPPHQVRQNPKSHSTGCPTLAIVDNDIPYPSTPELVFTVLLWLQWAFSIPSNQSWYSLYCSGYSVRSPSLHTRWECIQITISYSGYSGQSSSSSLHTRWDWILSHSSTGYPTLAIVVILHLHPSTPGEIES
jgi:hypothetical protein